MTTKIDDEVLQVLLTADCEGNELRINSQLDRKLYTRTNKVLEAIGGKWNRKAKAHVFEEDVRPMLDDIIVTGEYVDPKKEFQFYETPAELAAQMCEYAWISPGDKVLEPSAGRGSIANAINNARGLVGCVEIQPKLCELLAERGFPVQCMDFLHCVPKVKFDAVVMNPPFCRGQDIDHVRHAYEFVRDGGRLVAITSTSWTFSIHRKARDFRDWISDLDSEQYDLEAGTFKASGTMVRAAMLVITK